MISEEFPYESKFVDVLDSTMHYVEIGEGDPILFLHGNPTSSYLWRNIIPHLQQQGRCIAVDLIGMGKSAKPDLAYGFFDHSRYLEAFIEKHNLKNLTLVVHDWGGALGFHYAMRHEENVKAICFMETIIKPVNWDDFLRLPQYKIAFKLFRTKGIGWFLNGYLNLFIKQLLPGAILRKLSPFEKAYYAAPYKNLTDRVPLAKWPQEIPINGEPKDVHEAVKNFSEKLQQSKIPKLLLYAKPGAIFNKAIVKWCEEKLPNLKSVYVGNGAHFIQEDVPDEIGKAISTWLHEQGF